MTETIEDILRVIKETAKDEEFRRRHKHSEKDFTRKRDLSFEELVYFVIGSLGTSMDFEVLNFCQGRTETVSAAAISKARDKVRFEAFKDLLVLSARAIPAVHKTSFETLITLIHNCKYLQVN